MIDYDDLRRKAEAAESWMKLSDVSWAEMWPVVTPIYNLEKSLPPSDILRLLRIIKVAVERLEKLSGFDLHSEAKRSNASLAMKRLAQQSLDEIAKIEDQD